MAETSIETSPSYSYTRQNSLVRPPIITFYKTHHGKDGPEITMHHMKQKQYYFWLEQEPKQVSESEDKTT